MCVCTRVPTHVYVSRFLFRHQNSTWNPQLEAKVGHYWVYHLNYHMLMLLKDVQKTKYRIVHRSQLYSTLLYSTLELIANGYVLQIPHPPRTSPCAPATSLIRMHSAPHAAM